MTVTRDSTHFPTQIVMRLIVSLALLVLLTPLFRLLGHPRAQTDVEVSEEKIQENLKNRLEKALEDNPPQAILKRAWVGELQSIANNTLTIETREGPKQASVSAETSFVRLPQRTKIGKDDLAIGSHTIAMGTLNGSKVLSTARVIEYATPRPLTNRESQFAAVLAFDPTSDSLTYTIGSQESLTARISDETIITASQDSTLEEASLSDLVEGVHAVLITKTEEEDGQISRTLLRLHLLDG